MTATLYQSRDRCRMSDPEDATDAELAARARGGDRHALDILVRRHEPLVIRLVDRLKLPSAIDRRDVRQEGLLALARAAVKWVPGHGSRSKFTTYAWMAVRNAIADEYAEQMKALSLFAHDDWSRDRSQLDSAPAPSGPDPQTREAVEAALAHLPRLHREAVRLVYGMDGEPVRVCDVAAMMGLTRLQVKGMLAAARRICRRAVGDY